MTEALQQQKEEGVALNNTWGRKSANFYGRNKENDDESNTDDDDDELEQAKRLQAIKASKMKRYMQQESEDEVADANEPAAVDSSSDSDAEERGKLGDRLFTTDEKKLTPALLREYAKEMDPKTLEQLIEKDSPELTPMLFEL